MEDFNFKNITKKLFKEYESVRKSGSYNMYDWRARYLTSLTRKQWITIIKHYNKTDKVSIFYDTSKTIVNK